MNPSTETLDSLIERLADTVETLPRIMREFDEGALRRPPPLTATGVETFSAIGHLCHLRDIEIDGYHVRIHRLRSEEHPALVSLSGEALAIERGYDQEDRERALAAFLAARRHSVGVLRLVEAGEWGRAGVFEGYGEVTLRRLVEIMVEHDAGHRQALLDLPRS